MKLFIISILCLCTFLSNGFSTPEIRFKRADNNDLSTSDSGRGQVNVAQGSGKNDDKLSIVPEDKDKIGILTGHVIHSTKQAQSKPSTQSFNQFLNPCYPSPCGANSECKVKNGAGSCKCLPYYFGNPYEGCKSEPIILSIPTAVSEELDTDKKIQLRFEIIDGEAWIDADTNTCDSPVDGKPNPCDTYVIVKIDGIQVYQTKTQDNTNRPNFREKFETGVISRDAIITFQMWDNDEGFSADDPMSTWSGNVQYYFGRLDFESNITDGTNRNTLRIGTNYFYAKEEIQLSFNIKDGQAWFDADSTTCDSPVNGKPNPCDTYVIIKIDGKQVYRTKKQVDTDYPIFNEIYKTGSINKYSIITFEMWDGDEGFDDPMSTWSGYAYYYLTRDLFVGHTTDSNGKHRNLLSISTKVVEPKNSDEMIRLLFNIADGQAWYKSTTGTCDYDTYYKRDRCDAYVIIKIDGKQVYRTKTYNDTSHPIFNELFETGWINVESIIEFEMMDKDSGRYDDQMAKWSGNAQYYLTRQLLTDHNTSFGGHQNSLIVSTTLLDRKNPQDIKVSFNITDGQAWFRTDSTVCDSLGSDNRTNICDAYFLIKIDGKMVYRSKVQVDTDHPIYNEIFETGWIDRDAIITFEIWDNDHYFDANYGPDEPMSTWRGNVEYYLARDVLEGNFTDGTHQNSLKVSTKVTKKPEDDYELSIDPRLRLNEEAEEKEESGVLTGHSIDSTKEEQLEPSTQSFNQILYQFDNINPCNPNPCSANTFCTEQNGAASCHCLSDYFGDPYKGCVPECTLNRDCPSNRACIQIKCVDPCPGMCPQNAECQVLNHLPKCV